MFRATRQLLAPAQAAGKSRFARNWLSDSATYPIIAIISGACGLVVYQGQRIMFSHPDITVNKEDRSSFIRDNDADAEKHHEHFLRTVSRSRPNSDIMPSLNKMMVQGKVRE